MALYENARTYTAIGTGALGLATGLVLSYSLVVIPIIDKSRLRTKDKLTLWHNSYEIGKSIMVPLPLVAAATLGATAWSTRGLPASKVIGAAAALSTGHIFTTLLLMLPTNNRLMALQKQSAHTETEEKESDELLNKWLGLHGIRIAWLAAAMTTAFVGLLRL